jgi:hypothetical protein
VFPKVWNNIHPAVDNGYPEGGKEGCVCALPLEPCIFIVDLVVNSVGTNSFSPSELRMITSAQT